MHGQEVNVTHGRPEGNVCCQEGGVPHFEAPATGGAEERSSYQPIRLSWVTWPTKSKLCSTVARSPSISTNGAEVR
jgi:hypothetical protein